MVKKIILFLKLLLKNLVDEFNPFSLTVTTTRFISLIFYMSLCISIFSIKSSLDTFYCSYMFSNLISVASRILGIVFGIICILVFAFLVGEAVTFTIWEVEDIKDEQ